MKKISLILAAIGIVWAFQTVQAQTVDSTKNRIEIKKKVKVGAHGRKVTKIKMEGTGTTGSISGAADGVATGKLPEPAVTTPPPPVTPTVVVVTPQPEQPAPPVPPAPAPAPAPPMPATTVTTTTETQPVHVSTATSTKTVKTTSNVAHKTSGTKHVYHTVYKKKPASASSTKVTTTTTVKKEQ